MSTTKLNVRINHKYDTYDNWKVSSLKLGKGEIAVCEIPTGYTQVAGEAPVVNPPAIGIKIGDGEKTFSQLNWIQATAGDVYAWAKDEHLDFNKLDDAFLTALHNELPDTNTTYDFKFEGTKLKVFSKEATQDTFDYTKPILELDINPSSKMDVVTGATNGNLAQFNDKGQVVDSGKKIGDYLTTATASATYVTSATYNAKVGEIEGAIDGVSATVDKLVGTDSGKSVREIANAEIAAQLIPADAKEALNTLQEIADWIQDHPEDASKMNTQITTLNTKVGVDADGNATGSGLLKDVADLKANVGLGDNGGLLDRVTELEAVAHDHGGEAQVARLNSITADDLTNWRGARAYAKEYADGVVATEKQRAEDVEGGLNTRLTTAEGEIDTLQTHDQNHEGRIQELETMGETWSDAIQTVKVGGIALTKSANAVDITSVPVTLLKNVNGDELVFECGNASGF